MIWTWLREAQGRRSYMTLYWRAFGRFLQNRDGHASEYLGIPVEDLWYMTDILTAKDLETFAGLDRDPATNPVADGIVTKILNDVDKQIKSCANSLRFVDAADPGCTSHDWIAQFKAAAVKVIYQYDYRSYAFLVNTVRSTLWKLLSTLQKRYSCDRYAQTKRLKDGTFVHFRSSIDPVVDGDVVDVLALEGQFTVQTTDSDLDAAALLQAVERSSRKVAQYLRVVAFDDDTDDAFTSWITTRRKKNLESVSPEDLDVLARKYFGITQSDIEAAGLVLRPMFHHA